MEGSQAKSSTASPLVGPEAVTIKLASRGGPFANNGARLLVPPTRINLVNTSAKPVLISRLTLDPLQQSEMGARAESNLTVEAIPLNLAPGESALVTISGSVPTRPAVYTSILRVMHQEGPQLAVRVEFRVAAWAAWGFACMVLGLLLVGLINVLDSESGIKGELRRALLARQSAHEFLQQTPPPQSRATLVENANREFDAAVAILQKPRELSFVDRRAADAQEHLKTAAELTADLRKALSEKPRGSIEMADLEREWMDLKDNFAALLKQFLIPAPSGSSLAQRLGAFDAWAAQRLLRIPIEYYTNDFTYHVTRIRLIYGTGRDRDAATEAAAVRRWMQRAADFVNKQVQHLTFFVQLSANDMTNAERIRQRVEAEGIAADRRSAVLNSLDDTASLLSGPFSWPVRRTVAQRIQEARTETLRAATDAVLAAAESARAQEENEDSIGNVQAVVDDGAKLKHGADGKIDPKEKMVWLRRVVAAWRTRLATLPNPDPPALRAELDAFAAANDSNDLDAIGTHSRRLFEQWAAYSTARAKSLILKATASFCLRLRDDILIDLEATQQTMRRLGGSPNLLKWEGELDRLRTKTDATPDLAEKMPLDCLDILVGLSANAHQLKDEVDSEMWSATVLPDITKHELATEFATSLTPGALANLSSDTRPLHIEVATPFDELYVGRRIEFKIDNLGPDWGPGIVAAIDFGDGQRRIMTAEDLRKNKLVTHTYADAKSFTIVAIAAEAFEPDTMEPVNNALGEGRLQQLSISPSPISAARQLADTFFNARFGLALLIAGLLYFWRYYATKSVFGANTFDYAQAFAVGFAVSLAVNDLPQKLAEFISTRG